MSTEAPRWRLINAHYLNVRELPDGTRVEWEHKETSRDSGRAVRKLFPVPMLLNPNEPADRNYPDEIIVAHAIDGARNEPRDYIFSSSPTPEMEPLNDAAQAITDRLRPTWEHPIETLPVNGGMSSDEQAFMAKMMQSFASQIGAQVQQAAPAPNAGVSVEEFEALKKQLAEMKALLEQKSTSTIQRRA